MKNTEEKNPFILSVKQDWAANKHNPKAKIVLLLFRLANYFFKKPKFIFLLAIPYLIIYRLLVEWILGIEIPWKLSLGGGARIFHGFGLVINDRASIGKNVVLRHSTTIGEAKTGDGRCPIIGDNVDIGAHVAILGAIRVGDNVFIGAGSVVVRDVPSGSVIVGNPARVIRVIEEST